MVLGIGRFLCVVHYSFMYGSNRDRGCFRNRYVLFKTAPGGLSCTRLVNLTSDTALRRARPLGGYSYGVLTTAKYYAQQCRMYGPTCRYAMRQ